MAGIALKDQVDLISIMIPVARYTDGLKTISKTQETKRIELESLNHTKQVYIKN